MYGMYGIIGIIKSVLSTWLIFFVWGLFHPILLAVIESSVKWESRS